MQRLSKAQTRLLEQLITSVSGYETGCEEHRHGLQSALSTLRFHKFLSVSSIDVERNYDRLMEKLMIHSQDEKCEHLRLFLNRFLDSSMEEVEGSASGEPSQPGPARSELHFAMLAFLWGLQCSPQAGVYRPKVAPIAPPPPPEEQIDWHQLLVEDMSDLVRTDYDSDSSDFEEDDDEEIGERMPSFSSSVARSVTLSIANAPSSAIGPPASRPESAEPALSGAEELEKWLRGKVHSEYWRPADAEAFGPSRDRTLQFKRDWDAFSQGLRNAPAEPRVVLKETQVVREVLWMLSGAEESFVFKLERHPVLIARNRVVVKGSVGVCHVTDGSLDALLASASRLGSIGAAFRAADAYVRRAVDAVDNAELHLPRTTHAFLSQCLTLLARFQAFVHSLEAETRRCATHTLLELAQQLRVWHRRLAELHSLLLKVTGGRLDALHWEATVVLLVNGLFDLLCAHWAVRADADFLHLLCELFVHTLEPYLASVDALLAGTQASSTTSGQAELFLFKRPEVSRKDIGVYWRQAFGLKKFAGSAEPLAAVPQLLLPFARDLIVTIKSMDLLIVIAEEKSMPRAVKEVAAAPGAFVTEFARSTALLLRRGQRQSPISAPAKRPLPAIALGEFTLSEFTDNPLLRRSLRAALPDPADFCSEEEESAAAEEKETEEEVMAASRLSQQPLRLLLRHSLQRLISERHGCVSRQLLCVLLDRLELRRTLQHLQEVFLFARGHLLDDLTTHLFGRMQWPGAPWREALPLNLVLQECLHSGGLPAEEASRFWLSVEAPAGDEAEELMSLAAFDGLALHFQPPWPLDLVLTSTAMQRYAAVFRFLLQLRRVKSSLEALQPKGRSGALLGRLLVLRLQLLHVVNSLHQFFMHRIIHSAVLDFERRLDAEVGDVLDLITLHGHFVARLHRSCLLAPEAEVVRLPVLRLLSLGLTLERKWLEGGEALGETSLGAMETQLRDYALFLTGLFGRAVQSAEFRFLEPLAAALAASGIKPRQTSPRRRRRGSGKKLAED